MEKQRKRDKWTCIACGYVFPPSAVDATGAGEAPGTMFEDLPADWECPECGSPKSEFQRKEGDTKRQQEKEKARKKR